MIFIALCFLLSLCSCGNEKIDAQTEYIFGTVCTVNLFEDGTEELYKEVFSRLNSIDNIFNVNEPDSEISKINLSKGKEDVQISKECYELLVFSKEMAVLTNNSFNPTLGSLTFLWREATDLKKVPSIEKINQAKNHCDPDSLVLLKQDSSEKDCMPDEDLGEKYFARLTDSNTKIDLGAIVKGYATDEIVKILKNRNVKRAIIDLGGNIYVHGKKSQSEKWKVGIKNPIEKNSTPIKIIEAEDSSIVTSGDYERFFEVNGKKYHHIIDCKTGFPAESGLASVSIIYSKSVYCDVLSTAYFVAGSDADFVEKMGLKNVQIEFIKTGGEVIK